MKKTRDFNVLKDEQYAKQHTIIRIPGNSGHVAGAARMVDLSKIPDPPENQSDTILYWDDETRQWMTFKQRRRLFWKRIGADAPRRTQYKRRYDTSG